MPTIMVWKNLVDLIGLQIFETMTVFFWTVKIDFAFILHFIYSLKVVRHLIWSELNILYNKNIVTSHYVIEHSLISIWDMKEIFGGEAKHDPQDSTFQHRLQFTLIKKRLEVKLSMNLVFYTDFNANLSFNTYKWKVTMIIRFTFEPKG